MQVGDELLHERIHADRVNALKMLKPREPCRSAHAFAAARICAVSVRAPSKELGELTN